MNSIMKAAAAVDSVKEAGVEQEYASHHLSSSLPFIGALPGIARMLGMLDNDGRDERDVVDDSTWLPVMSSYRLGQRERQVHDEFAADREAAGASNKLLAETQGPTTSLLASGLLGAGIGGLVGRLRRGGWFNRMMHGDNTVRNAIIGGVLGLGAGGLAHLGGALGAAHSKRRTREAQRKYETGGSALANYLIPGVSTYNRYKRLGYSKNYEDAEKKRKREAEQSPVTQEKAQ